LKHRAGGTVEDLCRACKIARVHTVMAASPDGLPVRVVCDYCGSQHNYRGGAARSRPLDLVGERERSPASMSLDPSGDRQDLELMLRRIIREETGLTPVAPAEKWREGHLVLRPGREGVQEKEWPIETFFHKIVMVRNRLRVLEQQINGAEVPENLKIKLQSYITACYGSLTSFNVLFADEADRFRGSRTRD
jgi:hypothetical protein